MTIDETSVNCAPIVLRDSARALREGVAKCAVSIIAAGVAAMRLCAAADEIERLRSELAARDEPHPMP